ncbi:MAG: Ni/Fe-hydrogenase, b-type cytochrome subunit [Chloroflexi bacterium]|nr:Ni/Fe-hydrogenase, b-type cytochrome subunit [Chloroflexota bacterium]
MAEIGASAPGLAAPDTREPVHPFDALPPNHPPLLVAQPWQRVRVYVWEVPVRITHWVTVTCVIILSLTGGYIADPFLIPAGGETMGIVRFIHMLTAYVFVASGIVRTYWLFRGNRFARWQAFIPTNRRHLNEFVSQTEWYLFIRRELPGILGHNALAAATYMVVFFLFAVQTGTGFALEAQRGATVVTSLFSWMNDLFGVQTVRLVHHLVMWAILAFMIHHVYAALLIDHIEKNGLMSSIFSGFKFATRRDVAKARDGGIELEEMLK